MSSKSRTWKQYFWLIILGIIAAIIAPTIIWFPDFWLTVWIVIEPWLWFILSIVGILLIYKLISFLINRYAKRHEKFPKDAANGLILFVRIIVVFAIIFVVLPALDVPSEYLVDISTVLATAIGFASTIAISNIVAGFYMIISRPYKIGDYINVGGSIEGVVQEVGLNYSKIVDSDGTIYQIPNNKLFSSNIVNFSSEPVQEKKEEKSIEDKLVSIWMDVMVEKKIERYIFDMELTFDIEPNELIKILDQICDRWEKKFGYKPRYFFYNLGARAIIRWALFAENPETIMNNKSAFLEDIWFSVYPEEEEVN